MVDSLSLSGTTFIAPAAAAAPAPLVVDFALPPPQAALALSGLIDATVTGRDGDGVLLLRTDFGTLALKTTLSLPAGTPVELKLFAGPPAGAQILSVNGTPIGVGTRTAAPPPGAVAPAATPAPSASIELGQTIRATVLSPANGPNAPPAGSQIIVRLTTTPASASAGTTPTIRPPPSAELAAPTAGTPGGAPPPTPGGTPTAGTPVPASTPGAAPVVPGTPLPGGASVPVPPSSAGSIALPPVTQGEPAAPSADVPAQIPGAPSAPPSPLVGKPFPLPVPAAAPATLGSPTPLPAVVSQSGGSVTVVDTPVGRLSLEARLDLAPGTRIDLERFDAPAPAARPSAASLPSPALGNGWPALDDALRALDRAAPNLAAQLRADLTPNTAPRLTATLLFFVGVLQGSTAWPPEGMGVALAGAGRDDLRTRLQKDVDELKSLANGKPHADWRVFTLPVLDENAVHPVRLYVRRDGDGQTSQQREERGSRFVLDLDLSRLGPLQLDGLVRKGRFDLVFRSHEPVAQDVKTDVATLFRSTLDASGFAGDIAFVTTRRFPVAPLDELRPHLGIKI